MMVGSLCTGYGGLDLAIGGELAFVSEIDRHACTVIDARFPDVPNLGDLTKLNTLPECDVLTAGFPCQPVSQAGWRKGTEDERWLWDDIERLLGNMERPPGIVFLENVRGLLTANGGDAMARIVQGLRSCGYVGSYRLVRASDVGAPHRRERAFFRAEIANASHVGHERGGTPRHGWTGSADGGDDAIDTESVRLQGRRNEPVDRNEAATVKRPTRHSGIFGPYWPAVRRWEWIIGRPAPTPTDATRLNPRFVEWMMGVPDGWVTDCDIPRTAQLKILGNGVVPQQARLAWEVLS